MYRAAEDLVGAGHAYVDSQSADEMRARRGDFANAGRESPYRARTPARRTSALFRMMRAGEFADGAHVLRAKIDMASPNINLRDPVLYRIRHAHHHRTGDKWRIYPMYDYTHCISRTRSRTSRIRSARSSSRTSGRCTTGCSTRCARSACRGQPRPHQYEFARLNVSYVVTSKRKLKQLWSTRRSSTAGTTRACRPLAGLRRRGYTPESIRLLCERAGTSKAGGWTDYASLEIACATTSTRRRRGRWRCSTRCASS